MCDVQAAGDCGDMVTDNLIRDAGAHVGNVVPLRRPADVTAARLQHPSMYDGGADLLPLTVMQRQLLASLLLALRAHAPSPRAINDAVELLTGHRP